MGEGISEISYPRPLARYLPNFVPFVYSYENSFLTLIDNQYNKSPSFPLW